MSERERWSAVEQSPPPPPQLRSLADQTHFELRPVAGALCSSFGEERVGRRSSLPSPQCSCSVPASWRAISGAPHWSAPACTGERTENTSLHRPSSRSVAVPVVGTGPLSPAFAGTVRQLPWLFLWLCERSEKGDHGRNTRRMQRKKTAMKRIPAAPGLGSSTCAAAKRCTSVSRTLPASSDPAYARQ